MNSWLLLAMTIGPGFAIMGWVYFKDRFEKEPLILLAGCFLAGMVSTVPVLFIGGVWKRLGFGISENLADTAIYAYLSVGFTEEFVKWAFVMAIAYPKKAFNEPFDGIVYCVAVSMGFATAENLMYVYVNSTPQDAAWTAILRMFTAVPAHASFGILMGYFLGQSKFRPHGKAFIPLGLLAATFLHGSYDLFLFIRNIPGISIGALVSLGLGVYLSRKAIGRHQSSSPFKPKAKL